MTKHDYIIFPLFRLSSSRLLACPSPSCSSSQLCPSEVTLEIVQKVGGEENVAVQAVDLGAVLKFVFAIFVDFVQFFNVICQTPGSG